MDPQQKSRKVMRCVSDEQRSLCYRLLDANEELKYAKMRAKTSYVLDVKSRWNWIAAQLNVLEGANKTGLGWRNWYTLVDSRRRKHLEATEAPKTKTALSADSEKTDTSCTDLRKQSVGQSKICVDSKKKNMNQLNVSVHLMKNKISKSKRSVDSKLKNINQSKASVIAKKIYSSLANLLEDSSEKRKSLSNECVDLPKKNTNLAVKEPINVTKSKESVAQAETREEILKFLAATLHDIKTNNVTSPQLQAVRQLTVLKLSLLLSVNDYQDRLPPKYWMTIVDWLLFDTLLVHQPVDVIHMDHHTVTDKPVLIDLVRLVDLYNIESLTGDQLAEAWAALTLDYNRNGRKCTPMLLQRRWYQFKLATRQRFLQLPNNYMEPELDQKDKECRPTPLQISIVSRYKRLLTEPFMTWEDQIKHKYVILREQFESIAMNKSKGNNNDVTPATTSKSECVDLTEDENPIAEEFETITIEQSNPNMYVDENIFEGQEVISLVNDPLDTPLREQTDDGEDSQMGDEDVTETVKTNKEAKREIDIEMHLPYNTIQVSSDLEPVLPKITNIFGNVIVPFENLPQISQLAEQAANNPSVVERKSYDITTSSITSNNHISTNFEKNIESHIEQAPIDANADNVHLQDDEIEYQKEIFTVWEDKVKTQANSKERKMSIEEKNTSLIDIDKKLLMAPAVKMLKLDDMGLLPIDLLSHVSDKEIIDTIDFKSKAFKIIDIRTNTDAKLKSNKKCISSIKKVKPSSILFQKPCNCSYNAEQLTKNPDFHIKLKNLNLAFFESERNRLLLRSCRPLCVDVSKAFETKLVNGTLYLEASDNVDFHKDLSVTENYNVYTTAVHNIINNTENDIAPIIPIQIAPKPNKIIDLTLDTQLSRVEVKPLPHRPVAIMSSDDNPANKLNIDSSYTKNDQPQHNSILNTLLSNNQFIKIPNTSSQCTTVVPPDIHSTIKHPWVADSNAILDLGTVNSLLSMFKACNQNVYKNINGAQILTSNEVITRDLAYIEPKVVHETTEGRPKSNQVNDSKSNNNDTKQTYCCWARQKLDTSKTKKSFEVVHSCPHPICLCCCKESLGLSLVNSNSELSLDTMNDKENEILPDQTANFVGYINESSNAPMKTVAVQTEDNVEHVNESSCAPILLPIHTSDVNGHINELSNAPKEPIPVQTTYLVGYINESCEIPMKPSKNSTTKKGRLKETKKTNNELKNIIPDILHNSRNLYPDKLIFLGRNKILLTTTKIPKVLKKFKNFQYFVKKSFHLPVGIDVILQPNGFVRTQWKNIDDYSSTVFDTLKGLVYGFNRLNIVQHNEDSKINKSPDAIASNQDYSDMQDSKTLKITSDVVNESISKDGKETDNNDQSIIVSNVTTTAQEKVAMRSELGSSQQFIQSNRKDTSLVHKMQTHLGPLLCKKLIPIKWVSELEYAYSQNGLFFKFDLESGLLMPMNIRLKENRKSRSEPTEPNTAIELETELSKSFSFESNDCISSKDGLIAPKQANSVAHNNLTPIEVQPCTSTLFNNEPDTDYLHENNGLCIISNIRTVETMEILDNLDTGVPIKQLKGSESVNIGQNLEDSNYNPFSLLSLALDATKNLLETKSAEQKQVRNNQTISNMIEKRKKFICNLCLKSFTRRLSLKKHKSIIHGRDTFCCDVCNKQFFKKYLLKFHLHIEHRDNKSSADVTNTKMEVNM